jgi:hypothetical protein
MSDWSNDRASQITAHWNWIVANERAPLIDFSNYPSSSSGGSAAGAGGLRAPARVSDVLMTIGIFLGVSVLLCGVLLWPTAELVMAPVAGAATAAPFFAGAWLLRVGSKSVTGGRPAGPWTVLVRWILIGAAAGMTLGLATPVLLGADISAMEGLRVFAPAGLGFGVVTGLVRAAMRRKKAAA